MAYKVVDVTGVVGCAMSGTSDGGGTTTTRVGAANASEDDADKEKGDK